MPTATLEKSLQAISESVRSRARVSREDASLLYQHASDELLSQLATQVKSRYHDPHAATYLIMAIVNYTNICVAGCDYCSFYRYPHDKDGYLLSFDELCTRIDSLISYGGTLVGFNGGFHPKLKITDYAELFAKVHARYGDKLEFFEMTVAEFIFSCQVSKISLDEGARILRDHGTRWVTGGGAEILDDGFRKRHSPGKFTVEQYFAGQKAILDAGLGSTATMVIGFDETIDERLNHLSALREFQDSSVNKMPSFLCWTYKPFHNKLGGAEVSTREYLRWLAVCRIFLDNFAHIRTSVLTKNEDALLGLKFGANDFDLPTEDEVTQKAGATVSRDFQQILEAGAKLGFRIQHRPPFQIANSPTLGAKRSPLRIRGKQKSDASNLDQ